MKTNIRWHMFETNSSSVHSMIFNPSGRQKSELPVDDEGYILTDFGWFDKDYREYWDQETKLSYLVTYLAYEVSFPPYDELESISRIYDSWDFKSMQESICGYTGAKGIKILGEKEPYLDHQSSPCEKSGDSGMTLNLYDGDWVIDFVFNENIGLRTDCD